MSVNRPMVLSIAGFDPSGGAGILADIKCFEEHEVYGLAANTANTWQNESQFEGLNWTSERDLKNQIRLLWLKYIPEFVKIGLVSSLKSLEETLASAWKWEKKVRGL